MPVAFSPGTVLNRGDLDVFLTNPSGNPTNAAEITFSISFVDPGPPETEVLIGSPDRTPVNPAVGEYFASIMIPPNANAGTYRIRWKFREFVGSPLQEVVQEFAVVIPGAVTTSTFTTAQQSMIDKLRILLRDNKPDRNYHFRPPEHEGVIGQFNQVFGFIWEDHELLEYLERALDWWNMYPPETEGLRNLDLLVSQKPTWRTAVLWSAIVHAATALMTNWISEEFSYSIGGVSLDLERSSKYESLKSTAEAMLDKAAEAKQRTTKYIRGLQQPKYGLGIRSSFGPAVGRGVLSPRNFLGV